MSESSSSTSGARTNPGRYIPLQPACRPRDHPAPIPALQSPGLADQHPARNKSQEAYRSIGGGSPLRRITDQQARELQSLLRQRDVDATTYVAMRYWHPFTESAVADMKADGIEQVVVLPLYPHFSISTSGSSFRELQRLRQAMSALPSCRGASRHDHPGISRRWPS